MDIRLSGDGISGDARQACQISARAAMWLLACCSLAATGCTAIMSPVSGVPAHRLPREFLAPPKNDLEPVDIARLRQPPPSEYLVDTGDILGIYIENILGKSDEAPPVHIPEPGSDLPPAIGFPIPVRDDGTLALPLVPAIPARGLTLAQVEAAIREAYTDNDLLPAGKDRTIVTLMRKRTYRVVVMRQDGITYEGRTELQSTRGQAVNLPAYENDVLNALAETGGLPGLGAKNEVQIMKVSRLDAAQRDKFIRDFYATPIHDSCLCRPPLPEDPAIVRIPLRLPPGETPTFKPEDIILEEGDIVYIESREREVFYTGGVLGGGEFPLPRDYDLDVLGALSIAGTGVAGSSRNQNFGGLGGFGGAVGLIPPGQLFILRKTPCEGQISIAVDLTRAIRDPKSRPLIQPGDVLILQYKPEEEVVNFGLGTFFTFGIGRLLQGR